MPDITSITAVLSGIKTATEIAKFIKETDLSLEAAETKLKIAELVISLAEAKMALVDVQDDLREKDQEIGKLNDALKLKTKLMRHNDSYYEVDTTGSPIGDPYCSHCFESKHLAVHISQHPINRRTSICPACNSVYSWQRRQGE